MSRQIQNKINSYTEDKIWWLYIPVPLWLGFIFYHHLQDPFYSNFIFGPFNLVIHEAGHYAVFAWFGDFISILGGSLLETLFPILFLFAFLKQKEYFGAAFCLGWLATSLFGTALYIGDAQEMYLPLLGGSASIHDWNYLLTGLNILHLDDALSSLIRFSALISMSLSLTLQIFLISKMFSFRKKGL